MISTCGCFSMICFGCLEPPACAVGDAKKESGFGMADIEAALIDRKVWLAASTHAEEENGM
jgi:hypothetical protein